MDPEAAGRLPLRPGCWHCTVPLARLGLITLDCADPAARAVFWAGLLGGEAAPVSDDVVMVKSGGVSLAAVPAGPIWLLVIVPALVFLVYLLFTTR